jgi:UDP-glucuronate 4-epimerase
MTPRSTTLSPSPTPTLVTGCAGFIGHSCCKALLAQGLEVVGLDHIGISPLAHDEAQALGSARLAELLTHERFVFSRMDVADRPALLSLFSTHGFQDVLHLAARAGVLASMQEPASYLHSNIEGFSSILEACRIHGARHLVYASSSSVYGANRQLPYREEDPVGHPASLYAATKRSNELMAHAHSQCYGLPTTGLRFFTVYGPWGRPDMAPMIFARAIMDGCPIELFNHGQMSRDFTYIDDLVHATLKVLAQPATPDPSFDSFHPIACASSAPWRVLNIGNRQPVTLIDFVDMLEAKLGRSTQKLPRPARAGESIDTFADTSRLLSAIGYEPSTPLDVGLGRFAPWFLDRRGRS